MKRPLIAANDRESKRMTPEEEVLVDFGLAMRKVAFAELYEDEALNKINVVLVATGSFNPPTVMHARMFELATDLIHSEGNFVAAAYMSPVNDACKKQGLISGVHRLKMCELVSDCSETVMVDPWQVDQSTHQHTLTVLERVESYFLDSESIMEGGLKVMLLCGSDVLHSFSTPGLWTPKQLRTICRDYGIICINNEGQDIEKVISNNEILSENRHNIKVVDEVQNSISSTRVREFISKGLSVKYLVLDEVIDYIKEEQLYQNSDEKPIIL